MGVDKKARLRLRSRFRLAEEEFRIGPALREVSLADPKNIQEVAASQIKVLEVYHQEVLRQARRSFDNALIASVAGLLLFVAAVALFLRESRAAAVVSTAGGAIASFLSTVHLVLYDRTRTQLFKFYHQLDVVRGHLLANSVCESLRGPTRDQTRARLVYSIAGMTDHGSDKTQEQHSAP